MKTIIKFISFVILLCFISCDTNEPPLNSTITLKLEDISCTEAWIELNTTNIQLPTTATLKQNNQTNSTINLVKADTLLYIDSLLPNQSYSFIASHSGLSEISSNELNVTTMDTTNHDFTFQTWSFGDLGSSVLFDVAIVNENNIWAVGEIFISDTSELGYTKYNAVHWNGNEWELKRILYQGSFWDISTIFAFSENDIWFSAFVRFNGENFIELPIPSILMGWSPNKIWGSSSGDLFVVGNNGNIVHYNGSEWTRIESGTELNINDIWGDYNQKTGEWEILVVASNKFYNEGKRILMIDGFYATELSTINLPWSLSSIWFKSERKYFVAGDGLYYKKKLNESWVKDLTFIPIYKDRIRGVRFNDIVVSGSNGLLSHFNGFKWKHYINNELPFFNGRFLSSDIKDNVIIAAGWKDIQAIITMGKRN